MDDSELIVLRSPFNGELVRRLPSDCPPPMVEALVRAGFVLINRSKKKVKEQTDGTSEADGHAR